MSPHLLASGVRGLAPAGVPRGAAPSPCPWLAAPSAGFLLVGVFLAGCSAPPELPPVADAGVGDCAAVSSQLGSEAAASPSAPLREKLDAALLGLVEGYEGGGFEGALAHARSSGLDFSEKRVSVRVLAASAQGVDCLEQWIRGAGGSVESNFENSIFASVPVGALRAFAASESVWRVDAQQRLFAPPAPAQPLDEPPPNSQEDGE